LVNQALAVARRVRRETALGSAAVSVSYAAVELAKKIFGNLSGKTILWSRRQDERTGRQAPAAQRRQYHPGQYRRTSARWIWPRRFTARPCASRSFLITLARPTS